MPRPYQRLERAETPDGVLELRGRGDHDRMITIDGRVLMTTSSTRTEQALAELGCSPVLGRPRPRVLIGGLGLGITLRAALDLLPADAVVRVAELNEVVVSWCRGAAAAASGAALADPRVEVVVRDVCAEVRDVARDRHTPLLDAVLLDLYLGPGPASEGTEALYGAAALSDVRAALAPGGVYAVWGEAEHPPFVQRLRTLGFDVTVRRPPRGGGPRHVVYVAVAAR